MGPAASYRSVVYYEWRCCVEVRSVAAVSACCVVLWVQVAAQGGIRWRQAARFLPPVCCRQE